MVSVSRYFLTFCFFRLNIRLIKNRKIIIFSIYFDNSFMFTGLVKYLMKLCRKYFFTKKRSKSRVSEKLRLFNILEIGPFRFCFVKNYLLQRFIRYFTNPVNMTELSKYMEKILFLNKIKLFIMMSTSTNLIKIRFLKNILKKRGILYTSTLFLSKTT